MVIWLTGLSGVGKTTFAQALCSHLKTKLDNVVLLDGDVIRSTISSDLGFHESDRIIQINRVQRLAKILADQGIIVIVAVVYAHPKLLDWNRENLSDYFEVYFKASLETLAQRDPKGIYRRARDGQLSDVVGIDIPWHAPHRPDLIFDQDAALPATEMVRQLLQTFPKLPR